MPNRAAELWGEKLDRLLEEEPVASSDRKFALSKEIEETKAKLREHGVDPDVRPPHDPPPLPRLPPRPARCFGRTAEVEALVMAFCREPSFPTPLLGGPGMGKSTISLEALHDSRVKEHFGARRFFVRCETATTGAALVQELARGLGLDLTTGGNLTDRVLTELEREPAALVLDNLETPWWAEPEPVAELLAHLAGLPGVTLAVSLRGTKRPLRVAWGPTVVVEALPPEAARQAFLAIAGDHLGADTNLDGLLEAVERIALAVELLAHQAEGQPDLIGLRRRWADEKVRVLEVGRGMGRLSSLVVSLKLSIESQRTTPTARRLLAILGALPDGIAVEDIPSLLDDGDAATDRLRQIGLVSGRDPRRLQLLAPVRELVANYYLPEPTDMARANAFYLDLALCGERVGADGGGEAAARLSAEISNLEIAVRRGLESASKGPAIDAAVAMARLFWLTGLGGSDLIEGARRTARDMGDAQKEAECIQRLGDIAFTRSENILAKSHYQAALIIYKEIDNAQGQANCIKSLGDVALDRSAYAEARSHYDDALVLYQQIGHVLGQADCVKRLGDVALDRSEKSEARMRYQEALPLYQKIGHVLGQANCVKRLGDISLDESSQVAANFYYNEALSLYQNIGSILGEANCIKRLGDISMIRLENAEARVHYEAALPLYRRVGDVLGEANCLLKLGNLERDQNLSQARQLAELALGLYHRIEDPFSMAEAHLALARFAETKIERRRHAREARALQERINRPDLVAALRAEFGDDVDASE